MAQLDVKYIVGDWTSALLEGEIRVVYEGPDNRVKVASQPYLREKDRSDSS